MYKKNFQILIFEIIKNFLYMMTISFKKYSGDLRIKLLFLNVKLNFFDI